MVIKKVLVDTSFLIELANKKAPLHERAKKYNNYFLEKKIKYTISPIVVSEFWNQNNFDIFSLKFFEHLNYTIVEGKWTSMFKKYLSERSLKISGHAPKICVKDDLKILSHLIARRDIDGFITKDSEFIKKYYTPLCENEIFKNLKKTTMIDINNPLENYFAVNPTAQLEIFKNSIS